MAEDIPGWGVKLQTEVETLQGSLATHIRENRETHKDLYQRTERPSWAVTVILTVMSSSLVGLIVWVSTH